MPHHSSDRIRFPNLGAESGDSGNAFDNWRYEMKARSSVLVPMVMGMSVSATAHADVMEVMVGDIQFLGMDFPCAYSGEYGHLMSETVDQGQQPTTVVEFDLSGFIMEIDFGRIAWIRVTGPSHETSQTHPGADMDLFMVDGLSDGMSVQYHYDGPNPMYDGMSSDFFASSLAAVDVQYGQTPVDGSFLSLGTSGSIVMTFDELPGEGGDPGDGGDSGEGEDPSEGGGDDPGDGGADEDPTDGGSDDQNPGNNGSGGGWPLDIDPDHPALMDVGGRIWHQGIQTGGMQSGLMGDSLVLRLNEIAPISEVVTLYIGFEEASMPIPGPAGGVMALTAFALRRRRTR